MLNWLVAALFGVCIALGIGGSTAAAADDLQPPVRNYAMTPGRLAASSGALVGLIGVVIGVVALRSAGRNGAGSGRSRAIAALMAGLISMSLGGFVVAAADGGLGTGGGLAGGIVALVVGLICVVLGGLALVRSRQNRTTT